MNSHQFLLNLSLLVSVFTDAAVLIHVFPAFLRTKKKAFLILAIACVLGIIETVCDHTIVLHEPGNTYFVIRRITYMTNSILWTIGVVLLTLPYLKPAAVKNSGDEAST